MQYFLHMKNADRRMIYVWSDAEGCSLEIAQQQNSEVFKHGPDGNCCQTKVVKL